MRIRTSKIRENGTRTNKIRENATRTGKIEKTGYGVLIYKKNNVRRMSEINERDKVEDMRATYTEIGL